MRLRLAIAGEDDPCAAALLYGRLHTAWGILYPLLDETLRFKKRRIEFKLDFDSAKTVWEGDFSVTISIGRLIGVFLTAAGAYMKQEKASIPRKAV
ncbi:MAG: DUF2953 domain-containing protein [Oscillospiraceae bacterium]|nr:DUF2953 domain-containing protein [Oscillospiraceae bacterium]